MNERLIHVPLTPAEARELLAHLDGLHASPVALASARATIRAAIAFDQGNRISS